MTKDEQIQAMRDDIQSWTPEDLRVGLMLQYRRISDLVVEVNKWKTDYVNAMDVNTNLRAKIAERSKDHLEAHITYDKGYQVGLQDASDAKYDEDEVLAETARYRAEVERLHVKLAAVSKELSQQGNVTLEHVMPHHLYDGKGNKTAELPGFDRVTFNHGNLTIDASAPLVMGNRTFNEGVEACMSRLYEMHRTTSGRHNYYGHAALELAKLK